MANGGIHIPGEGLWAAAGAAITGAFAWLTARRAGKAAQDRAVYDGFKELVDRLRVAVTDLERENGELLQTIEVERAEFSRERLEHAAEVATLRGEINNLTQAMESLKQWFRRQGIPVPENKVPATVENPGQALTVLRLEDPPPDSDR